MQQGKEGWSLVTVLENVQRAALEQGNLQSYAAANAVTERLKQVGCALLTSPRH
jgi:hypothetical protein